MSNFGAVKSLRSGRNLSAKRTNRSGYKYVNLARNGKYKSKTVHRLVAEAFLPDFDASLSVNHIDGVKTNNRLSNLEMVTPLENAQHAQRLGLTKALCGEEHGRHKLTEHQVREIRASSESAPTLAKIYGVSRWQIMNIKKRINWEHI